ncbi:MAG TPA: hypothetical protein VFY79_00015 [Dehalococcoidia bacterium]|nr:hypothetical protein [Dehalococcoidia bacterium]
MAVRTWVGRFTVVDGRVQEEGPWLGSLIRQRPDEPADELYILIEPATPGRDEYTSQLVDVIARLYQRDPLSLTGALVRSLKAAHEHLRDWNAKSLKEHQAGAGASCLTLRGTGAYLAQAGPSLAYVRASDGSVRRIAAPAGSALGLADDFEPQLTRLALAPGDLVLLASTALEDVIPQDHIERVLERGADDALRDLYLLCRDRANFSLVLLSCFEQDLEAPPEYLTRAGDARADEPDTMPDRAPDAIGHVADVPEPAGVAPEPARASLAAGSFDLPRRPVVEEVREIRESTAPPPNTGVRLRAPNAAPSYRRSTGQSVLPRFHIPKIAIFAAAALALLGLVAWVYLPGSVKQNREDRFNTLIADARESSARAQSTSDPGAKRQLLTSAQASLADAAKIHSDDAQVTAMTNDVSSAITTLNAVYEIKNWTTIQDLSQTVTGGLSVTRSVVAGNNAFFLDARGNRVLRLKLDGTAAPETVLTEGGFAGLVQVSKPVEITWSEQTSALLVVDDKRQVFAYFPSQDSSLPLTVRGADGWGGVDAIAASGGNLYVLDVKNNQVWRYLPGQGGFDSERTGLLDQTDLSSANGLAVGQDVYVLDQKAGIRRFVGKTEAPATLGGIDTPLVSPASLAVLPGSNRLIVADRGNKRVVVASADGAFLRQIVSPAFTDLRAVSVDEGTSTIYVLNGDKLMKAVFPP